MSTEWEEYKQREQYFNEMAEMQREKESEQLKEQEYIEQLGQRLREADKVIAKCEDVLKSGLVISPGKDTHQAIREYQAKWGKNA